MSNQRFQTIDVSATASGDTLVVAPQSSDQTIVIYAMTIVGANAVLFRLKSGTTTNKTGRIQLGGVGYGFVAPFNVVGSDGRPIPHIRLNAGDSLYINLSSSVEVGGWISYALENATS